MENVLFIFSLFFIFTFEDVLDLNRASSSMQEDLYWRDYDGITPKDALKGGRTYYNSTTYIGQSVYANHLIPGQLIENERGLHFCWEEEAYYIDEHIQVTWFYKSL